MKNNTILALVLFCILLFFSCNSGNLSNDKAKEVFLKANPKSTVHSILKKKMSDGSYIVKISFYDWGSADSYNFNYIFTKFDTGWTCKFTTMNPQNWE